MEQNIVQVEFFHVGGRSKSSLEELFKECDERIADSFELALKGVETSSGIKTVVRFFDTTGVMTKIALRSESIEKRVGKLFNDFDEVNYLRGCWLNIQSRRLVGQMLALKDDVQSLAAKQLREEIKAYREVAVECPDHSFRQLRREEEHELIEAAEEAKGAWLFVFEPNDLLADENAKVASAM